MKTFARFGVATAIIGGMALPAAAQNGYYPQQPYPQQTYPNQGYQQQGYGQQGGIAGIINQLLGNRYQSNDRTAITQCASAASAQASAGYGRRGQNQAYGGYQQGYAPQYNSPYMARVTAISN